HFLDEAWRVSELSKLVGKLVSSNYSIKLISEDTNAASKLDKLLKVLGDATLDTSKLRSLSKARNCLTHYFGIVTSRHTNSDDTLIIKWTAFELRVQQGEGT